MSNITDNFLCDYLIFLLEKKAKNFSFLFFVSVEINRKYFK